MRDLNTINPAIAKPSSFASVAAVLPLLLSACCIALANGAAESVPLQQNPIAILCILIVVLSFSLLFIPRILKWDWNARYFCVNALFMGSVAMLGGIPWLCILVYSSSPIWLRGADAGYLYRRKNASVRYIRDKVMSKIGRYCFVVMAFLSISYPAMAQEPPVIGLWEKIPVGDPSLNLVARTQYVFTNKPLKSSVVFTGLRLIGSELSILCCVVVKNIVPVNLAEVLKKYSVDPDFVAQLKSVKGLDFAYEAEAIDKPSWNEYFNTVMKTDDNPHDLSPFSAIVIAVDLSGQRRIKPQFKIAQDNFSVKAAYPKREAIIKYEVIVNDKKYIFSENAQEH